jgi:hypothetical protein
VLDHWNLITLDLHDQFGIDCGDRALMRARPWSWMRLRIRSLLQIEGSRLRAVLMP